MDIKQEEEIPDLNEKWTLYQLQDGIEIIADSRKIQLDRPDVSFTHSAAEDAKIWVKTSEDEVFEFDNGDISNNRKEALAFAALWHRTNGFEIGASASLIPIEIAALGKPAIATYLDTTKNIGRDEIAQELGVSEGTIGQYVSKVRRGHR